VLKLTKMTGETLMIAPTEVTYLERAGGMTIVRTRDGQVTAVLETPEDILIMIEEWRRGLTPAVPTA
jgi:sRNA-binding carbon storage regulator CsrA